MKKNFGKRVAAVLTAAALLAVTVLSGCGGKEDETASGNASGSTGEELESMTDLSAFSLDQVVQTDAYAANALDLEVEYLTSFDVDKLLAGFRETAGLDMQGATRYGGWESSLIGGHAIGHYMSAMAQAYANAGVSDEDRETIYAMLTELVDGLAECQENSQGEEGFLFAATIIDSSNVEKQFDNVEKGLTNITTQAWVPWYTMHKILAGLIDIYEQTGYEPALTVATGLGDWVYNRVSQWDDATRSTVLGIEYGGMNDVMYELYAITGEENYAIAAHQFDEETLFEKVLAGGDDVLNNLHANTTIPKFIGALKRYTTTNGKEIDGETVDASVYLEYAEAFWEMVVEHHTYITGGNSEWEHFGEDDVLDGERTNCNDETCNVYNMLKLSRMLYQITGDVKYMDFYENAFINSILSSQNSETGMTTYFQPMATGYFKVYSTEYTNFWCCTGSGMENFTKLNDSIYFYSGNNVVVNLYMSSELTWEDQNLVLTQTADFPNDDTATFTVSAIDGDTVDVNLRLRVPDWAAGDVVITVNGSSYDAQIVDGYACVTGSFADGDEIAITIPMEIVAYTLPDDETSIAFKYGPVVLSADLGTEDLKTTTTGVSVTIPAQAIVDSETITLTSGTREELLANPGEFFTAGTDEDGNVVFTLNDTDLVFGAHYLKNEERYGIYWYFKTEDELAQEEAAKARSTDVVVDTVQPGYGQYENDELHDMQETDSVGVTNDGTYRYAEAGGSFTYRMAVAADGNNYLSLTLRAEDNDKTLQITSGDTVLFADTLDYIGLEETYELRVAIPDEVLATAETVTANGEDYSVISLTFSGIDGAESARVCEFIYMLDVTPLYESDASVAYFVDCGDYDTTTVSDGDAFGVYNSVTEQLYGYDPVTGMKWGLIDDANDQYGGSANNNDALYTAHTWAYEYNDSDGIAKEDSNRYTKNQYEDGIVTRYLDYAFELPDGTYTVEIGFSDPWGCSNLHDVYANIGTDAEVLLAESYNVSSGALTAEVTVSGGQLTLNFRNSSDSGLAINVSYIKICFAD